jgi:hypothetical protein
MHASSCPGTRRDPLGDLLGTSSVLLAGALKVRIGNAERSRVEGWKFVVRHGSGGSGAVVLLAVLIVIAAQGRRADAQSASGNASLEGNTGLIDSILATPNQQTPVLQDNLFATAPGVEEAARSPQFTLNVLAPLFFNSNAQFLSSHGTATLQGSPVVRLAWASQVFDSPIRISGAASFEAEKIRKCE